MRDYTLTRAASLEDVRGVAWLRRLIANWRTRRAIARLDQYDDYILRDIGITRPDVHWAAGLPLTVNSALALEELSHKRRGEDAKKRPGWGAF